jgi:AP2-like factor, euAP2 lineage
MSVCPVTAVIAEIKAALQKLEDEKHLALRIPLRNKKGEVVGEALVDREDEWVGEKRWWPSGDGYGINHDGLMHSVIKGDSPEGFIVDHWNGNRSDNRRGNLRFVTWSHNSHNTRRDKTKTSSQYIGVHKHNEGWVVSYNSKYLGKYKDESWAAWHYNMAVFEAYGFEGNYNIIDKPEGFLECKKRAKSGLPRGVTFKNGKYYAYITLEGKHTYLGNYATPEEASKVYEERHATREAEKKRLHLAKEITRDAIGPYLMAGDTVIHVSEEDWYDLSKRKWCMALGYPTATITGDRRETLQMHMYLLGTKEGFEIDHIDGDTTNNTRENLRFATSSQNNQNKPPRSATGLKGVMMKKNGMFLAEIKQLESKYNLGTYNLKEVAAFAYDCAARQLYGEHAYTNNVVAPEGLEWDPKKMKLVPTAPTVLEPGVFRGIRLTPEGTYSATLCHKNKYHYLGSYSKKELAAYAYNCAAIGLLGALAVINNVTCPSGYLWDPSKLRLSLSSN